MTKSLFGEIDGAPVHRGRHPVEGRRRGQDPDLRRRRARSDRSGRRRGAARHPGPQFDRGLPRALAPFRRGSGALRQPHRRRPLRARRRRPHARPEARRKEHAARRTAWLRQAHLDPWPPRRGLRRPDARFARRRRRFPGRAQGDLRLPPPRTRDATGRADGDRRQADGRQPDPSRLLQPRRVAGHPRSRGDARRRLLYARRRRPHPDRRDPLGRRHALRLPGGAAGAQPGRNGLRHQFRRRQRARARRARSRRARALAAATG